MSFPRVHIGFFFVILVSVFISCASLPPEKDFHTELWKIDVQDMLICRQNDEGEDICLDLEMLDVSAWSVVKNDHIAKEWKYEALLKKECREWR